MRSTPTPRQAAVVITLSHDTRYTPDQETAFRHVRRYLSRWDTYAVVPQSHPAVYPGLIPKRFPDRFFGTARAHSALLLSERFYRAFLAYDYILIYHLDALVFADRLQQWCDAGYDYIGSPWLISPDMPNIKEEKVGNGGFSLRRVRSFLRTLRSRRYFVDPDEYWRSYRARTGRIVAALNIPRKYLKRLRVFNDVRWHIRWAVRDDVHEDRFWSEFATYYNPEFRIAPLDVAMRFAFEAEPRRCFAQIGGELPFGAHRWPKFDRMFYEPYLLTEGPGSDVRVGPAAAGVDGRHLGYTRETNREVGICRETSG